MSGKKFKESRCAKCIYRMKMSIENEMLVCNYSGVTGQTCLTREGKKVIDRRGDGSKPCKLFVAGERQRSKCENFKC